MTPLPILDLRDVSYRVDGKRILDRASWRVERDQHWAILGRNGAGKTTLLRIACGYLWPNAGGEVLRCGESLSDLRTLRRSIGWVTSVLEAEIPGGEPVLDTVVSGRFAATGLKHLGWEHPTDQHYHRAAELLDAIGMSDLAERPFGVLSQGERQKTLLARAQMAEPLLLILDEPCAGLDPASRESFLAAMQKLATADDAPTLILVTHHIEEIMPAFARALVMDQGRIIRQGPTQEILDKPLIDELYDTKIAKLVWTGGRCWPICS